MGICKHTEGPFGESSQMLEHLAGSVTEGLTLGQREGLFSAGRLPPRADQAWGRLNLA